MMRDDLFWNRVNAALDERRDPLADERVQDELAERPERLDELLVLQRRLPLPSRALEPGRVTPEPRRVAPARHRIASDRRRRAPLVAAAAVLLVTLGAALAWWLAARSSEVQTQSVASAPNAGEVLDFRLTITTERPGSLERVVVDRRGVVRELVTQLDPLARSTWTTETRHAGKD